MKVSFTPQARGDLVAIRAWIAEDNERAAERVVARIVADVPTASIRPEPVDPVLGAIQLARAQ